MIKNSQKNSEFADIAHKDRLHHFLMGIATFLPHSTWELIENRAQIRMAEKGTMLLCYQQHENCARFLIQGVIKILKHCEKECYVFGFREENNFIFDVGSLFENKPSDFCIETLCDCMWLEFSYSDILFLRNKDHHIDRIMNVLLNHHITKTQEDNSFFLLNNAKERYLIFCKENPNIIKTTSLSDIASYLRITQQSLSRIRKEVSCL